MKNSDLETMRTPAGSQGVSTVGDFWKNRAQFYFLKNDEISCHHPFKKRPQRTRNLSGYLCEEKMKFGLRT